MSQIEIIRPIHGRSRTCPSRGASSPVMQRMAVVLPAPLGPSSPSMAPASTPKLTPLSTLSKLGPGMPPRQEGMAHQKDREGLEVAHTNGPGPSPRS
eukprot:CAMPEP_0170632294 /NCGR_PEP_ID=MMETSP0224-20130122/35242_1 /TAXON_ID=285029 /ORGANISM="Togula jolla, Strain CCCM 725" /LENGTH=96 /DNA_ID=CAMNT_0010960979 /DNA_START=291 /DNA_END=582 /DNA_ORIENTATION=+